MRCIRWTASAAASRTSSSSRPVPLISQCSCIMWSRSLTLHLWWVCSSILWWKVTSDDQIKLIFDSHLRPKLCYLYADLYKHTNSKEARRIFTDFLGFFIDRGAVSGVCFYTSCNLVKSCQCLFWVVSFSLWASWGKSLNPPWSTASFVLRGVFEGCSFPRSLRVRKLPCSQTTFYLTVIAYYSSQCALVRVFVSLHEFTLQQTLFFCYKMDG